MSKGRPAAHAFVPKKGRLRKVQKGPATMKSADYKKVPYVRGLARIYLPGVSGWNAVEDVFNAPKACDLRSSVMAECVSRGAFIAISIDGAYRVCLSIMGQLPFNMKKESRNKAAFKDQDSIRRVITVRGKTGAVVAMFGAPGESSADIMKGLELRFCVQIFLIF